MIHGFDDTDKSKIEVYSKGDFVLLEAETAEAVASETSTVISFSNSDLKNIYNIEDLRKYRVIGVEQEVHGVRVSDGRTRSYSASNYAVYPSAKMETTVGLQGLLNSLSVAVFNSQSSSYVITARVVLLKVEE